MIAFQVTSNPGVYNLAFGDKNSTTGELDDLAINQSGDNEKVPETDVAALYFFF